MRAGADETQALAVQGITNGQRLKTLRCALDHHRGNFSGARLGIERGDILAEQAIEIGLSLACLLVE